MIAAMTENTIEQLLGSQFVGRIGCYNNEEIYIVPVSYGYDGSCIYVHAKEGKKINMMRQQPRVCFEVENITDMANWQTVVIQGKYEEITDEEEKLEVLELLLKRELPILSSSTTHLGKTWPFSKDELDQLKGVVFRIRIAEKTGRFERTSITPTGVV